MSSSLAATLCKKSTLRVGLIGGGVVGGGTYDLLVNRCRDSIARQCSKKIEITKLCVRDAKKERDFELCSKTTQVVTDIESVVQDESIDVIVEVMGGTTLANTVVRSALSNKKAVVTANKALLAEYLKDWIEMQEGEDGILLQYEASVCGGIPIINTLQTCYTGDVIQKIQGICNGTTNYMLGKMEEGVAYDEVLKEAQALGYAEADPTADVEGHDVRAKLCLLTRLAFGMTLVHNEIPCRGISEISTIDFEHAKSFGWTIKLVGTAERLSNDATRVCAHVSPCMVPRLGHALGGIRSNGNAVAVTSDNLGTCLYTGPGAGRYETANSIVADVVRLAKGGAVIPPFGPTNDSLQLEVNYEAPFYIRLCSSASWDQIKELGVQHGVAIDSELPIQSSNLCLTTKPTTKEKVDAFCKELQGSNVCDGIPLIMPILGES